MRARVLVLVVFLLVLPVVGGACGSSSPSASPDAAAAADAASVPDARPADAAPPVDAPAAVDAAVTSDASPPAPDARSVDAASADAALPPVPDGGTVATQPASLHPAAAAGPSSSTRHRLRPSLGGTPAVGKLSGPAHTLTLEP